MLSAAEGNKHQERAGSARVVQSSWPLWAPSSSQSKQVSYIPVSMTRATTDKSSPAASTYYLSCHPTSFNDGKGKCFTMLECQNTPFPTAINLRDGFKITQYEKRMHKEGHNLSIWQLSVPFIKWASLYPYTLFISKSTLLYNTQ